MITNSSKKELDSKKEELISVDLREIVEEPLDTSSVLGLSDEEQIKHYDKQLGGLSQNAIKSQADQIINYADNYLQSGILPVATLFENCSMVMEKHIKEDELIPKKSFENFKMSLRNSQDCIKNSSRYLEKINELKDSKCSFIMAPINAIGHVFSAAIYKKGENYEVILINKGARYDFKRNKNYHICERYIIPKDNIKNIVHFFGNMDMSIKDKKNVDEIYRTLEDNSYDKKNHPIVEIEAREQRVGNCFFKEVEEGLKYVYSEAFLKYESKRYNIGEGKYVERVTPKLPCSTKTFHIELINNLKEHCQDKNTIKYLEELVKTYSINKQFRDKINMGDNLSYLDKEKIFFETFGNGKDDVFNIEYFKDCLKRVDERTLRDNLGLFMKMLKNRGIKQPLLMYEAMNMQTDIDFLESYKRYIETEKRKEDLEFLDKYFPTVAGKIRIRSNDEELRALRDDILKESKKGNYDVAETMINKGLLMNPTVIIRSNLYKILAEVRIDRGYQKEAIDLYKKAYYDASGCDINFARIVKNRHNKAIREIIKKQNRLKEINKILKTSNNLDIRIERATLLREIGKEEEAISEYSNCIDIMLKDKSAKDDDLAIVLKKKADLLKKIGGNKATIDNTYYKALEILEKEEMIEKDKEQIIRILEYRADILKEIGQEKEARKIYREIIKKIKARGNINLEKTIKRVSDKLDGMELKKDVELDIIKLKMSKNEQELQMKMEEEKVVRPIDYNKDTIEAVINRARKLEALGKDEEALQYYLEGFNKVGSKECFYNAIRLCKILNKSEEALKIIEKEIENPEIYDEYNNPKNEREYRNIRIERFNFLRDLGMMEEALDECNYILDDLGLENANDRLNREMIINKATLLQELGYKKQALKEYQNIYNTYSSVPDIPRIVLTNIRKLDQEIKENPKLIDKQYIYGKYTLNIMPKKEQPKVEISKKDTSKKKTNKEKEGPHKEDASERIAKLNKVCEINFEDDKNIIEKVREMSDKEYEDVLQNIKQFIYLYKRLNKGKVNEEKLRRTVAEKITTMEMKKLSPTKQEEPVMVIQKRSTSRNLVTQKIQLIKEMTGVDFSKDEKLLKIAVKMDNNEIEQLLGGIKHNDSIKPHDIKKRLIEGYIENKMKKLQNNRSIPNVNTTKTNTIGNVNKTKTTKDLE